MGMTNTADDHSLRLFPIGLWMETNTECTADEGRYRMQKLPLYHFFPGIYTLIIENIILERAKNNHGPIIYII